MAAGQARLDPVQSQFHLLLGGFGFTLVGHDERAPKSAPAEAEPDVKDRADALQ